MDLVCSFEFLSTTWPNDDLGLTLTFFMARSDMGICWHRKFIGKFQRYWAKNWYTVLLSTGRFVSTRVHGHSLTFDPGLSYFDSSKQFE